MHRDGKDFDWSSWLSNPPSSPSTSPGSPLPWSRPGGLCKQLLYQTETICSMSSSCIVHCQGSCCVTWCYFLVVTYIANWVYAVVSPCKQHTLQQFLAWVLHGHLFETKQTDPVALETGMDHSNGVTSQRQCSVQENLCCHQFGRLAQLVRAWC